MTTLRRRVLRPTSVEPSLNPRQLAAVERQQAKLVKERESLGRWMKRLKRAFHAIEKQQQRISRLERRLATLR